MKINIKGIVVQLLFYGNIICVVLLILSALAPYVNPANYWPVALAGILFPVLLVFITCFTVFWLIVSRKKAIVSLAAIIISIPNISTTFGFNFPSPFQHAKAKNNVRVLTWNVGLMNYQEADTDVAIKNNAEIFRKLATADADIICLQEFFTAIVPGNHYNLMDSIAKTIHYPYTYFSRDIPKFDGSFYSGTIIFSRYRFADTAKLIYPGSFGGSIIKAGIIVQDDTIDIFTTRFQSVKFQQTEYASLRNIKNGSDSAFAGSRSIIRKLAIGYTNRVHQVAIARAFLSQSKRPAIFTGDFNDVPVSYTYAELKKGMSDAWLKKGAGLGRTFEYISPTLRIDNIFYTNHFKARQVERIITHNASDHYGLLADLSLE